MKTTKKNGINISDCNAEKIGSVIIEMLENCDQSWRKPWISTEIGEPRSLGSAKGYNGINAFMLGMLQSIEGYKTPCYITMNKVNELELTLNFTTEEKDGKQVKVYEKPFPVFFWKTSHKRDGEWISDQEYDALSESEQEDCDKRWVLKTYNVFNLDQTNFAEKYPDRYAKFEAKKISDNQIESDYENGVLDYMIETSGAWRCPITQEGAQAYYSPATDSIKIPKRASFVTMSRFYGTALHEMTHSTGNELKREMGGKFGSKAYAREELVAELSAAIFLNDLGVEKYIKEDSIPYVKNWCSVLKDNNAVRVVMDDVMRAVAYLKKQYAKAELKMNLSK